MGCGAVCGNSSSVYEPNKFQHKILISLLPELKLHKQFIPPRQFNSFMRLVNQNPLKYKLKIPDKLVAGQQLDPDIITKWKVILYCLGTENQQFRNCLSQNLLKKNSKNQPNNQHQQLINLQTQNDLSSQEGDYVMSEQTGVILSHSGFGQIEKDIDRTGQLPEGKKAVFERILKRICNYFPKMGYTQGINFIICYFLKIGLGQFDAFWIFVHMAICRRFLFLGLYEDQFPLSLNVYNYLFKNILRRVNNRLHNHLYENVKITDYSWLFKWYGTYFSYSFPHQMIKYVFDIMIQMGGLGLIKIAIAITEQLSDILMEQNDQGEISMFLESLKDIDTFNQYISIKKLVEKVYTIEIKKQDFRGIQTHNDNFYSSFFNALCEQIGQENLNEQTLLKAQQRIKNDQSSINSEKNVKSTKLLNQWYKQLLKERQDFKSAKTQSNFNKTNQGVIKPINQIKQRKNSQRISIENQLQLLVHSNQSLQQSKSPDKENSIRSNKNSSLKDSVEMKKNSIPSTGCSYNQRAGKKQNIDDVSQIDELWDEQDCNSSVSKNMSSRISQQSRTQTGFNIKVKKAQYEDELDKFASTHCNPLNKSKYNNSNVNKSSSIFNGQKASSYRPKINNFHMPVDRLKGGQFVKAAQHILTNLSIKENSQNCQSSNSEYSKMSQKQKKSKQNDLYSRNYLKNKMKKQASLHQAQTQNIPENNTSKQISHQDCNSSSRDSCVDPQNSFYVSNEFINEDQTRKRNNDACSVRIIDSHRNRLTTHQDSLTNSLYNSHIKQNKSKDAVESNNSEIQLFQAPQVFKKKNRVSSRIDGTLKQGSTEIIKPRLSHAVSNANIHHNVDKSIKTIRIGIQESSINYEQSYESIFVPSESQKSNPMRFNEQLQKCEIESVK